MRREDRTEQGDGWFFLFPRVFSKPYNRFPAVIIDIKRKNIILEVKHMPRVFKLSQEKYGELRKELDYLKSVREKEVAQQIKEARSFGDLSENSEYDEAKDEQGKLYARIGEIENILSNCVIISDADKKEDEVCIGSTVELDYGDGDIVTIKLVGSQESDPMNMLISDESPLGHAIFGKRVNDKIVYEAPQGQITCVIKSIKA